MKRREELVFSKQGKTGSCFTVFGFGPLCTKQKIHIYLHINGIQKKELTAKAP